MTSILLNKAAVKTRKKALLIEDYSDDTLILSEKNIPTYSHSFHILFNSLEDMNNLPFHSQVPMKVDTRIYQNRSIENKPKTPIVRLCSKRITIYNIFFYLKIFDNLSTYFCIQSSIFRDSKDEVKKTCEELCRSKDIIRVLQ